MATISFDGTDYHNRTRSNHRISQRDKDADDKQWYKDRIDEILMRAFSNMNGYGGIDDLKRMKTNYDLFNNIIDTSDFSYVCQPYGADVGELPATLTNRDIVSPKIKVLLGMEIKRPFTWKVLATNEEATTRKEQEENKRMVDFVVAEIMRPIRLQNELKYQQESQGRQLSQDEVAQLQKQIEEETKQQTPDEVRKYMTRQHQDPAEALMTQLLTYLVQEEKVIEKFQKGWKHAQLSGGEWYRVYIRNDEPVIDVINPLFFDWDRSPDIDNVKDGEWATYKHGMTVSQIVATFGDELTEEQIDDLYNRYPFGGAISEMDWSFSTSPNNFEGNLIPVYHVEFKSLCKMGWLTYIDSNGEEQLEPVDENYKLNKESGDVDIEWEWIPQRHEGYKIGSDLYLQMRPVPGQHVDPEKLWKCELSYRGCAYENLNSQMIATMDRIKAYQYYFNIIMYRIEKLMASDRGKKLMMNIKAIPRSMGVDLNKWLYYLDALDIGFYNPNEEGNRGATDAGTIAKEVDMSLITQINQYIQLAEYIDNRAGAAIGVPKQMEGQISPQDAVTNTKQTIVQSSHILEPQFEMHNIIKGDALTALVECAKVAYTIKKPRKLSYILDDMTMQMLSIDQELLEGSSYGLYLANSSKANEVKQLIEQLAHAAMQNQMIELSDVIKVV